LIALNALSRSWRRRAHTVDAELSGMGLRARVAFTAALTVRTMRVSERRVIGCRRHAELYAALDGFPLRYDVTCFR
jgi:hypothetical protein